MSCFWLSHHTALLYLDATDSLIDASNNTSLLCNQSFLNSSKFTIFIIYINFDIMQEEIESEFVDLVVDEKEKMPYPICSVVAVFMMLVRILNTLLPHLG